MRFVREGEHGDRAQDDAAQFRRLESLDLLFSVWVTDCGTEMGKTVRLVEDARLDCVAEDDLLPEIVFEDIPLPEVLHAPLDVRHDAICDLEDDDALTIPLTRFTCRPWLDLRTGELARLIRGDVTDDYRDMTIRQIVLYLEHFVPW